MRTINTKFLPLRKCIPEEVVIFSAKAKTYFLAVGCIPVDVVLVSQWQPFCTPTQTKNDIGVFDDLALMWVIQIDQDIQCMYMGALVLKYMTTEGFSLVII